MKYIRTKDGRIVNHPHPNADVFTFRYEILQTADTIEKLLDCVVYEKIGYENHIESIKDFQKRNRKLFDKDLIVYGAIWTKGEHGKPTLKPVAKMNSEGELELL